MRFLISSVLAFLLHLPVTSAYVYADKFYLSVQPVLPRDQIKKNYKPLADYLSKKTGHDFEVVSYRNYFTYWTKMQRPKKMHFVLDAAHFTDYRIQRKNYQVLVKLPDTVSFTVVTSEDNFVFEMDELISKRIATMASPGLGAVRLISMFPNPMRLPTFVQSKDSVDAAQRVLDGTVDAAIIPSPLVGAYPSLNVVTSTDPVPHMALSASSDVPADIKAIVKKALLEAQNTPDGKQMLSDLNLPGFVVATPEIYAGYADLLEGVFGY